MTEFCHIAPVSMLDMAATGRTHHLVLAHLIETNPAYVDWYVKNRPASKTVIMDNSAFELYKAGKEMYPSDKLIEMGTKVKADYIVLTDYPAENSIKTISAAIQLAPKIKQAGFGTFFVPQSNIGDLDDLINAFQWAVYKEDIDYIGISILAVPNAYGVEKNNKLQRFLSRWKFMSELAKWGLLDQAKAAGKKIHFLGMVDGPNEIELVKDYLPYIDTWDSSAAVWAGINQISFDNSPTGLIQGKFEKEVEFDIEAPNQEFIDLAISNMKYIDDILEKYNE